MEPRRGSKERCDVLILEDDPDLVELGVAYLSTKNLAVRGLVASSDYVKDVREIDPRLLLLDVILPGTDGFQVCHEIKEDRRTRHIKVIMVTAVPREQVLRGIAWCGADGYIPKPFSLADLDPCALAL